MEYVNFCGIYADIPVDQIMDAWKRAYGEDRVQRWIKMFGEEGDHSLSDFEKEDVLTE
jgi:hypothetical protein